MPKQVYSHNLQRLPKKKNNFYKLDLINACNNKTSIAQLII